jgi:hypothetical protein
VRLLAMPPGAGTQGVGCGGRVLGVRTPAGSLCCLDPSVAGQPAASNHGVGALLLSNTSPEMYIQRSAARAGGQPAAGVQGAGGIGRRRRSPGGRGGACRPLGSWKPLCDIRCSVETAMAGAWRVVSYVLHNVECCIVATCAPADAGLLAAGAGRPGASWRLRACMRTHTAGKQPPALTGRPGGWRQHGASWQSCAGKRLNSEKPAAAD